MLLTDGMDLLCYCPAARFPEVAARLRRALAGLTVVRIRRAGGATPPETFVSGRRTTLVMLVDGRITGQAVGDLPSWELRSLAAAALRSAEK
jgi:hypothetical protein